MPVVYADVLLLQCFLMVFTAYMAAALIWNKGCRPFRIGIGSFVVSLVSTAIVLFAPGLTNPLSVMGMVMLGTYLSFGRLSFKQNLSISFTSLVVAFAISGAKAALNNTGIGSGLFVTAALLFVCLCGFLKKIRQATVKKQQFCHITVCKGTKSVELYALVDSGNELRGARSESVIVAERQAADCLFDGAETDLRLLPFKSAGGEGVLIGVLCDYALVNGKKIEGVITAVVDISLGKGYNALVGTGLQGGSEKGV